MQAQRIEALEGLEDLDSLSDEGEKKYPWSYSSKQRKQFTLELKEDQEPGRFSGYASVFDKVDLHGDVVQKGAFTRTIGRRKEFPLLWYHDPRDPIGVIESAKEDERGLLIEGQLMLDLARGAEVYKLVKRKVISGLSIGFDTVKAKFDEDKKVRIITEVNLWEVSVVTFQAQPLAKIARVKSASGGVIIHGNQIREETSKSVIPYQGLPMADVGAEWDADAAVARVREWAGCKEEPNGRYRKAFLWSDCDAQENIDRCMLPIADVVDGELTIIPKALFDAAATVHGAKGRSDLPDDDITQIKDHIGQYYKRMERDPPWEGQKSFKASVQRLAEIAEHADEASLKVLRDSLFKEQKSTAGEENHEPQAPFSWIGGFVNGLERTTHAREGFKSLIESLRR